MYYYQAMCHTEILRLDPNELVQGVKADPLLYRELFAEAGHHLKARVQAIENKTLDSLYKRVAHQLVFFAREHGHHGDRGHGDKKASNIRILIPLRHQDLADILESSRESITRVLGIFAQSRPAY